MRAFPIMRDLVTDVSYNFEVAKLIPPSSPGRRSPTALYRMAQVDIDRGQEFHKCIECFLCQNVCHVIRDHEENKATVRRAAFLRPPGRARDASARHLGPPRATSSRSIGIG